MKQLQNIVLILLLFSCDDKDLIIDRGILSSEAYLNNSLGIAIQYDSKIVRVGATDSLNHTVTFDQVANQKINFNKKTEQLLLIFHNTIEQYDIMVTLINSGKVKTKNLKEYLFETARERIKKYGFPLKITSSEIETLNINGVDYQYFSATYTVEEKNTFQKSKYAYKLVGDFIMLVDIPTMSDTGDKSPNKEKLIQFLNSISFISGK
ncbi:MAG: hypothetical protein JXJ22_16705 [Bacteroidales bacterium]|nr:hypothetical protein [Bacteroidales bacterium]